MLYQRWLKIWFFICAIPLIAGRGNYKIESAIPGYDGEKKIYLMTLFLPFNPTIVSYTSDPAVKKICEFWWPKGRFFCDNEDIETTCNLLWIDHTTKESDILSDAIDKVEQASVIYTITHCLTYSVLKSLLELYGFVLFGHWHWENEGGHAIFVKRDLFAAAMHTLNYSPTNFCAASSASQNHLETYFRKALNKSLSHKIDGVDFIYMINLDERPEKFARTVQKLECFGISPYRFSAVNGWKLSTEVINRVGVKFSSEFGQEKFLGSIYREIEGKEYQGNEILRPNGETFFSLGMSRGAIGIVLSHLSVLQDAYDSGYQTIWVMEDDIEAIRDPNLISELIPKLDECDRDWDILFTDTDTKDHNGNHVPCRAVAARPNVPIESLFSFFERFYPVSADFTRIGMRYGAYSMIVRRSGMEKILKYFKTYGIFIPYDMDIWLNPHLKMYSVTSDIISHCAGSPTDNSYPTYTENDS